MFWYSEKKMSKNKAILRKKDDSAKSINDNVVLTLLPVLVSGRWADAQPLAELPYVKPLYLYSLPWARGV